MRVVAFSLAGKPVAKGRVRTNFKTGTVFTPVRTVTYEGQLAYAAQNAMNGQIPAEGPLAVFLEIHMPIAASWSKQKRLAAERGLIRPTGRPDLDNFAKMLDALNHIVWIDDSQIVELYVIKRFSSTPKMTVTVDALSS